MVILALVACQDADEHKTVVCIPVYGQSLAIGVDAIRITDFDSLANYADGRIVTENMDHRFGYFDLSPFKQFAKKITRYHKRSFELTVYGMAEMDKMVPSFLSLGKEAKPITNSSMTLKQPISRPRNVVGIL